MSYILDALKRAEAERSRGEIPDLHAQPLGDLPAAEAKAPAGSRVLWVAGAAAIMLLGGAGGWWLSRDGASKPDPAVAVRPEPAPVAAVIPPAIPPAAAPTAPMQGASAAVAPAAPPPSPTITLAPAPVAEADVAAPPASPASSKAKALATAAASGVKADALAKAGPSAADAAAAPAGNAQPGSAVSGTPAVSVPATNQATSPGTASPDEKVVALRDLPDDVRASLPPLTVAGSTYSENPASRMLIINGKLVHEGDKLTPELTLQQIRLRSAVLSFRGTRFSISY